MSKDTETDHSGHETTSHGPQPLASDYHVVYHNADGTPRGLDGPGLVRMPEGLLMAVVPVSKPEGWRCQVTRSTDGGRNWHPTVQLPYHSAVPWEHRGALYLFAHPTSDSSRNGDLLLLRSTDGGMTWSDPVTLFTGHFWNCQTGMVRHGDRLYWAVDDLSLGNEQRGPRIVAADLSADPMDPQVWRISNLVQFPGLPEPLCNPHITGAYPSARMLEPNVLMVNERLRVLAAVKPPMQATTGLCAVFDATDDGTSLRLTFTQYHPMPGGQVKFCIIRDDPSGLFWAAANLVSDGQDQFRFQDPAEHRGDGLYNGAIGGNDRRFLMLMYGLDGLNWFSAGCVARARRLSQSFMYPSMVPDGDDLLIIARSSINGANRHDADCATLHRVRHFRRMAMDLRPETT